METSFDKAKFDEKGRTITESRDEHIERLRTTLGDEHVQKLLKPSTGPGWGGPANE